MKIHTFPSAQGKPELLYCKSDVFMDPQLKGFKSPGPVTRACACVRVRVCVPCLLCLSSLSNTFSAQVIKHVVSVGLTAPVNFYIPLLTGPDKIGTLNQKLT